MKFTLEPGRGGGVHQHPDPVFKQANTPVANAGKSDWISRIGHISTLVPVPFEGHALSTIRLDQMAAEATMRRLLAPLVNGRKPFFSFGITSLFLFPNQPHLWNGKTESQICACAWVLTGQARADGSLAVTTALWIGLPCSYVGWMTNSCFCSCIRTPGMLEFESLIPLMHRQSSTGSGG